MAALGKSPSGFEETEDHREGLVCGQDGRRRGRLVRGRLWAAESYLSLVGWRLSCVPKVLHLSEASPA